MGACAFEAYNVPYQTHGIKQVDGDGAEVVYMDRDFLASIVKGVMQVTPCPFLRGKAPGNCKAQAEGAGVRLGHAIGLMGDSFLLLFLSLVFLGSIHLLKLADVWPEAFWCGLREVSGLSTSHLLDKMLGAQSL